MFAEPATVMKQVFEFLEVPPTERIDFAPQNVGHYEDSDAQARNILREFYSSHNRRLGALTGNALSWQ
jgi:hypothetical protein